MLRAELEDFIDSYDHVVQIGVSIGLALPFVFSSSPVVTSQLRDSVFPALEKSHAFIELDSDIGERGLPDVIFLEFDLNPTSESLRSDLEEVLHSHLRIVG